MPNCFDYLKTSKIESESDYPYTGLDLGNCHYSASNGITFVSDYVSFSTKNPEDIIAVVNQ